MRILVTNDDGIDNTGLHTLASMAVEEGHDVVIAAPSTDASGTSAAMSAELTDDGEGRIPAVARVLPGLEDVPAFAVAATPAYIVVIACNGAFGEPPEVVLSGVNLGANTGVPVLHSGTVGAALTGITRGCRAMAVSLDAGYPPSMPEWATAKEAARRLLPLLAEHKGFALNVNVPNIALTGLKGIRQTTLAVHGIVQLMLHERGDEWVKMGFRHHGTPVEAGSDEDAVLSGHVSVTPLQPPQEPSPDVVLDLPF
jgi:5'-nucleotidase